MINQHLQAAIAELQEFIDDRPDAREVRKALFCQTGLSSLAIRQDSFSVLSRSLFQKSNMIPIV
ncbi:MAG: hypothetical protein KME32_26510 [Mojavia pulchra JT2-VF2]|jgi:putative transposase|uniref:Uncharacterized protein n=1 Tax=Mojavia pulchra JT2-VF2 TaxID=287848 RepID=A0A951Q5N5_9NOST|nr:hypothetical protein [Mojavia pulchra JT2-VF2]